MQTTPNRIEFDKIEAVRKRLQLTQNDMAIAFGVSRLTYIKWVKGGAVRPTNAGRIRDTMLKIAALVRTGQWIIQDVAALPPDIRNQRLLALLNTDPVQ